MILKKRPTDKYIIPMYFDDVITNGEYILNATITEHESIKNLMIDNETSISFLIDETVDLTKLDITVTAFVSETKSYSKTITIDTHSVWGKPKTYKTLEYVILSPNSKEVLILPNIVSGHFKVNTQYNVLLDLYTNDQDFIAGEYSFTTKYCPLFATIEDIKLLGGPNLDKYSDDTIYRMIHKNSMDAIDIFNTNTGNNIPYDYFGCDETNVPYLLRRYVECKTAYDLLTILDKIGGGNLSQTKSLGDMTIKYGGAGSTTSTKDPKDDLYDCYNELLNKLGKGLDVAVKGWNDESHGYIHPIKEPQYNRVDRVTPIGFGSKGPWRGRTRI